eukprot:TRINITY_DN25355_c0_g1_i1.p1 TRINITY_DN25355_c0_g1~~TRINITY_DN25355_c0_g1_i1.p1  ORF type:complete len:189 (+),score=38.12 TRINITY_DN25355_c0_g1_i1:111-677(+)
MCIRDRYTSSTLFHAFHMMDLTGRIFKVLDHCAIFVLIAGSYTPFCLITLACSWKGIAIVIFEWTLAGFGVVFGYICAHSAFFRKNQVLQTVIELSLYLLQGWAVALAWDDVVLSIHPNGMSLLLHGGSFYTIGIAFFVLQAWYPFAHVIWHCFVLAGSACHFLCVLWYVVDIEESQSHWRIGHQCLS